MSFRKKNFMVFVKLGNNKVTQAVLLLNIYLMYVSVFLLLRLSIRK